MKTKTFEKLIAPFLWSVYEDENTIYTLMLGSQHFFGNELNGDDYTTLARMFLEEHCPTYIKEFEFDSESDCFVVNTYSDRGKDLLQDFAFKFKAAIENKEVFYDLLSKAMIFIDIVDLISPFIWFENEEQNYYLIELSSNHFNFGNEDIESGDSFRWLAESKIKEEAPQFIDIIKFDCESDCFVAYSDDEKAIIEFALWFGRICEDENMILKDTKR